MTSGFPSQMIGYAESVSMSFWRYHKRSSFSDSKICWPHVGPTWILSAPRWADVGPTCLNCHLGWHIMALMCLNGCKQRDNPADYKDLIYTYGQYLCLATRALIWLSPHNQYHKTPIFHNIILACVLCSKYKEPEFMFYLKKYTWNNNAYDTWNGNGNGNQNNYLPNMYREKHF